MIAKINIVQDALAAADALSSRNSFASGQNEPLGDDKQQIAVSEADLYQIACELSDEGFGDFDDCLAVLSMKKGNKKLAKNALSKAIFSKQKLRTSLQQAQK